MSSFFYAHSSFRYLQKITPLSLPTLPFFTGKKGYLLYLNISSSPFCFWETHLHLIRRLRSPGSPKSVETIFFSVTAIPDAFLFKNSTLQIACPYYLLQLCLSAFSVPSLTSLLLIWFFFIPNMLYLALPQAIPCFPFVFLFLLFIALNPMTLCLQLNICQVNVKHPSKIAYWFVGTPAMRKAVAAGSPLLWSQMHRAVSLVVL